MLFDVSAVEDALKPLSDFSYHNLDVTPLLLTRHPGGRNARANALKSTLREMEETLSAVDRVFNTVVAIRNRLQNHTALVANALSPALTLPTEILAIIFNLFVDDGDSTIAPIAISHVCSRWRTVSLSLPSLWTNPRLPMNHQGMAGEFFRRSSPLPVHLCMRPLEWRPVEIEFNEKHAHRLQTLHLSARLSDDSLLSFSRCVPLLQLQAVSLDNDARYTDVHNALKTVRSLRLCGYSCVDANENVAMEHLTELTIGDVDVFAVHDTLQRIRAPALERLVLDDVRLESQDWREASLLDHRGFSSVIPHLSIRDSSSGAWTAIMHWPLTQLKSFSIEITDVGAPELEISEHFAQMVSAQPLDVIRISHCAHSFLQFQRCKRLESLSIMTPNLILLYPLVPLASGSGYGDHHLLPRLRTFRLEITPWEDDYDSRDDCALLLRVLRSRDEGMMPRLEQLEVTQKFVHNCQADLRSLVNNLILI